MKINFKTWILISILAVAGFGIWLKLSFDQLVFINLKINRHRAVDIAREYLEKEGYTLSNYENVTIFLIDQDTDRYLQRTLKFDGLQKFINTHHYDLFFWAVRFYREGQKEEFRAGVSSKTGEVISYKHVIDDTAARPPLEQSAAKQVAIDFLIKKFHFDIDQYTIKDEIVTLRDNRKDYSFSWQKKGVLIPWTDKPQSGVGKLATNISVTGGEVLGFSKNTFLIPDDFLRDLNRQRDAGQNLTLVTKLFYYILLIAATAMIVRRRNHLAMHFSHRFYFALAMFLFALMVINELNMFPIDFYNYKTSGDLQSYMGRQIMEVLLNSFFISILILMPGLAGELLHYESGRQREGAFLYYLRTSFLARNISRSIILGYLSFFIMLGLQAFIFDLGQRHLGVWKEYVWMTQMSTSYLPILVGLTVGFSASIQEELLYRFFTINWLEYLFKRKLSARASIAFAVIVSSALWGFAHSSYPVFPMWFRGIEVTTLGILLGVIYLRFGLVSVLIAHYLFDCFWTTAGYLFGQAQPLYVYSSLILLALPLIWALWAFIADKKIEEKPFRWKLNGNQQFNVEVLKNYIKTHCGLNDPLTAEALRQKILSHGWDLAIVDIAFEDLLKEKR